MGRRDEQDPRYPPGFAEALGRAIKVIRTDQDIERRDLAERAGISYSYLTEIENGNKPPSSSVLGPIAEALGLRMSQLIEAAENRMDTIESASPRRMVEPLSLASPVAVPGPEDEIVEAEWRSKRSPGLPSRDYTMPPSYRSRGRHLHAALGELQALLPALSAEDLERLLDMARRLARR